MLPKFYCDHYQEFLSLLLKFQASLTSLESNNFAELYQELQQKFNQEIIVLNGSELEGENYYNWQSLQTEIHRTFKLLQTQIMFLLTSRQLTTNQKHLTTIYNYLNQLIAYCQKTVNSEQGTVNSNQ